MADDKLDIILDELRAHRDESRDRHNQLDGRVRNVEAWQSNAEGKAKMLAVVMTSAAGVFAWLSGFLHK